MRAEFCLLGPLTVCRGGVVVPVPRGNQRVVLAALLLSAGRTVSVDELVEVMWGYDPPASARVTIRNYVRRLRRALETTGGDRIRWLQPGYVISVAAGELDVTAFEALVETASRAARDGLWERAASQARAALALWRGEPLADIGSDVLALRAVPRLTELRLAVLETRLDADLRLGRHADVVTEVGQLAVAYPMREHVQALSILALYRCGRQADALAAYQRARRTLVEEIGADPGPELRELHRRILAADPSLAAPASPIEINSRPGADVPRELPGTVRHFVGRQSELATLTELIFPGRGAEAPGTVVVSAIGGMAGVGKTTLALYWAHQHAKRFPDGQLYVNLRGYDSGQPVPASQALAGFLRALGVPGPDIPAELEERSARYRSLLAGRRMLVLLDNASSAEQVRPLLPGAATSVTIVTSRDSLGGLIARDGARRLDLDVLSAAEAVGLLRALIGSRVDTEPDAAATLAARCGHLPLALRVAAELAVSRPAVSLTDLGEELADLQRRLDVLDGDGDPRSAVRAVFSWSCQRLSAEAERTFQLAGLHPGPDFDCYAIAALTGTTLEQARGTLSVLARAHLIQASTVETNTVQTTTQDRYAMHDLLRGYACELAQASERPDGLRAALTRLLDHYLYAASAAMDLLFPAESRRRPRPAEPAGPVPSLADAAQARAWLDAAVANLVAAIGHAAEHGWPSHATRLSGWIFRFLEVTGRYPEIVTTCTSSLHAARQADDRPAEAEATNQLTVVYLRQGRYQQAAKLARQSLAWSEETGDHLGQARALGSLGIIRFQQGDYRQAADYQRQALAHYRKTDDKAGEPRALNNLGVTLLWQGHYAEAADGFRHALTLRPDPDTGSLCMANLGIVLLRQGYYQQAVDTLTAALSCSRQAGTWACEAHCLVNLGLAELRQGHSQQAAAHLRQALAISRQADGRSIMADALNGLGEVSLATGRAGRARTQYGMALRLTSRTGDRYEKACAHSGLGRAYHATGQVVLARHHWREALAIYTDLDVPDAVKVRAWLGANPEDVAGIG